MTKQILKRIMRHLGADRSDAETEVVRRAYRRFKDEKPEWANSLFDWHFVKQRALPVLRETSHCNPESAAARIALAWAQQWNFGSDLRERAARRAMPAAQAFLELLCTVRAETRPSDLWTLPDFCAPQLSLERIVGYRSF